MKTLLASVLGLTAMASVALAGEPTQPTMAQMDQVTAGAAAASFSLTMNASGPTNASNSATVSIATATVGGSAPSNTSTIEATLESNSE
jgi:hypothetical protein